MIGEGDESLSDLEDATLSDNKAQQQALVWGVAVGVGVEQR